MFNPANFFYISQQKFWDKETTGNKVANLCVVALFAAQMRIMLAMREHVGRPMIPKVLGNNEFVLLYSFGVYLLMVHIGACMKDLFDSKHRWF